MPDRYYQVRERIGSIKPKFNCIDFGLFAQSSVIPLLDFRNGFRPSTHLSLIRSKKKIINRQILDNVSKCVHNKIEHTKMRME